MSDTRRRGVNWRVCKSGEDPTFEGAHLAVLMDIRDELQELNRVFRCARFLDIPSKLDRIRANTEKPRKRRRSASAKGVAQ